MAMLVDLWMGMRRMMGNAEKDGDGVASGAVDGDTENDGDGDATGAVDGDAENDGDVDSDGGATEDEDASLCSFSADSVESAE